MPLLPLWSSNPGAIDQFTIEQVVTAAGDGNLKDGSECSRELRTFLSEVSSSKLVEYVDRCLTAHFTKGGMVLQDLVNELGRRLDFKVDNGRYQGTSNAIGFDGVWTSLEGHSIIAEVKTTDAYRISLDTIAGYREKLLSAGQLKEQSSILIIVGREDTGELEAQVRGSRHAWDIRLISADALLKLVQLKEESDAPETGKKIRSLLAPMEYTRLDEMIDVMFTTAKDVEGAVAEGAEDLQPVEATTPDEKPKGTWQFTEYKLIQAKREQIIAALARREGAALIKRGRALYWSANHAVRAVCTISKRYAKRPKTPYWYAYHPEWDEFLSEGDKSFFVLGCMDRDTAFAIPHNIFKECLDSFHTTGDRYWHIVITETAAAEPALDLPKRHSNLILRPYAMELPAFSAADARTFTAA